MEKKNKRAVPPSGDYQAWLIESLKNPAEAAGYLNAAMEEGDPSLFLLALRNVAEAHGGLLKLSQKTKLNRVNLYRMLSRQGNPEINSLAKLLDAMGFRLAIEAKSTRKRAA